jgi:hypothetical protein
VVLYAVPEPDSVPAGRQDRARTEPARALRLHYADRPHDAEALAAFPDGRLSLITKGRSGPVLRFEVPPEAWEHDDLPLATPDTLPIEPQMAVGRWVTGAAASPDGVHAVVRTYTEVFRFRLGTRWVPAGPACRMGLVEPQGEGVDFLDGNRLVLTSERARRTAGGLSLLHCDWD